MKKLVQMSETEFSRLVEVKNIEEMAEAELENYTEMFVDAIRIQMDREQPKHYFWCPKCESPDATVEIDRVENRGMANCTRCRIAVVIISSESEM